VPDSPSERLVTAPSRAPNPLVILGAGYVGRFLYHAAQHRGRVAFATSRTPDAHLSFVRPDHRVLYDLLRPETWRHVPTGADVVWCFPALPEDDATRFARRVMDRGSRLVVLGSTAAFPRGLADVIDERTPVNRSIPRVAAEERLRTTFGAVILRLAGIYGPQRHVLDWIRRGTVPHSQKFVNLVHAEDVAELCLLALQRASAGSAYIVSDGRPRRWAEICQFAADRFQIPLPPPTADVGKRLSSRKILSDFHYRLRHPDLFTALSNLESGVPKPHTPVIPDIFHRESTP